LQQDLEEAEVTIKMLAEQVRDMDIDVNNL
jgi:hypothetical protein